MDLRLNICVQFEDQTTDQVLGQRLFQLPITIPLNPSDIPLQSIEMAPKKDLDQAPLENIKALCELMASCEDFNPDLNVVATTIGIAQAKNVPRKINTIIQPAGYTIKGKKIMKIDDDATTPATPKSKSSTTPNNPTTDSDDDTALATPKSKNTKTKSASPKKRAPVKTKSASPVKTSAKKRKLKDIDHEDAENSGVDKQDSPATKAIKLVMDPEGNGHAGDEVKDEAGNNTDSSALSSVVDTKDEEV